MSRYTNFDAHDDCAEWAIKNMAALRTAEVDTRRAPNGCDQQGRHPQQAAEACTEVGADGVPSVWESADLEVAFFLAKGLFGLLAFLFLMWVYANA